MKFSRLFPSAISEGKQSFLQHLVNFFEATVIILFVSVLILSFDQWLDSMTLSLLFFLAIAFNSWRSGSRTGILSTFFAAIMINYLFLIPGNPFHLSYATVFLQFFLFFIEGILLSLLISSKRHEDTIFGYLRREREYKKKILEIETKNASYAKEIHSRDEFLSIASHELKTPLTSMLLQTQTALHNIRSVSLANFSIENLMRMLESVEHQTKRLSKMINDLLSVSLITTGNLQLEREEMDLDQVVQEVLIDFSPRIERENYKVIYTVHEPIVGYWDRLRIEQAISNFLSNAIKYGEREPIEIRIKKRGNQAEFLIKDNGIGISKEKQKKIFELFERGVSSEDYKGLGVGLHIALEIAKAHGGTIVVSSKPGNGSVFIMKLPLHMQGREQKEEKKE